MPFLSHATDVVACKAVCNINHSETKPLNGGKAEMLMQPMRKNNAVAGIL
jgi:hypothetical protein